VGASTSHNGVLLDVAGGTDCEALGGSGDRAVSFPHFQVITSLLRPCRSLALSFILAAQTTVLPSCQSGLSVSLSGFRRT
jgi:hypothetical protein